MLRLFRAFPGSLSLPFSSSLTSLLLGTLTHIYDFKYYLYTIDIFLMFLTKFIQKRSLDSSQTCPLPHPLSFSISLTKFTIYPGAQVKTPGITLFPLIFSPHPINAISKTCLRSCYFSLCPLITIFSIPGYNYTTWKLVSLRPLSNTAPHYQYFYFTCYTVYKLSLNINPVCALLLKKFQ